MTFYGKYSKIFKRTKKVGTLKKLSKTKNYDSIAFESIKHVDEKGDEYWTARELQEVLDYTEWRKFENVINKAKKSCENSGISAIEHFGGADKTIAMPKGANKSIQDYKLTRYACYLIAQNGDSRKKESHCSCSNVFCSTNEKTRNQ